MEKIYKKYIIIKRIFNEWIKINMIIYIKIIIKNHIIEEIKEWKNPNLQIFNNNKLYNQIKNIN